MPKKKLTVNTEGVFFDGIRQDNPDPHEVAEVLATPLSMSLWVREPAMIATLENALARTESATGVPPPNPSVPIRAGRSRGRPSKKTTETTGSGEQGSLGFEDDSPDAGQGVESLPNSGNSDNSSASTSLLEPDELLWSDGDNSSVALVKRLKTRFFPVGNSVAFLIGAAPFLLSLSPRESAFTTAKLTARNAAAGLLTPDVLTRLGADGLTGLESGSRTSLSSAELLSPDDEPPAPVEPVVLEAVQFYLHTGQEIDILERSAADGKRGEGWKSEVLVGKRVYNPEGASHRVELRQDDITETVQGIEELDIETLERLTLAQDTDFAFAMLYVVSTLAPPAPLPSNLFTGGWIDLDDVMEKIGWYPNELKAADREAKRAKIWNYLCYGNRAVVVGQRSGIYRDPVTGEEIPTRIESPVWRIMSIERPVQRALIGEVPRRVQVVISKEWEPLLVSARLAQYLPLAEAVGKIPPQKVAGDWARAIALVLSRLWRMKPQEFLQGQIRPTRRQLLTHYKPKTKTVEEILTSVNPRRAVGYWHDALGILSEIGFLERKGEAMRSVEEMLRPFGSYGWQEKWLDEAVELQPGEALLQSLQQRAAALPPVRNVPLKRKRGRPRKSS